MRNRLSCWCVDIAVFFLRLSFRVRGENVTIKVSL